MCEHLVSRSWPSENNSWLRLMKSSSIISLSNASTEHWSQLELATRSYIKKCDSVWLKKIWANSPQKYIPWWFYEKGENAYLFTSWHGWKCKYSVDRRSNHALHPTLLYRLTDSFRKRQTLHHNTVSATTNCKPHRDSYLILS